MENNNDPERISFDEMERTEKIRRQRENPWTAADEARYVAKSKREREEQAAWQLTYKPEPEETDDDDDEEENNS